MDLDVLKDNVSFLKEQLSNLREKQARLEEHSKALENQNRVFPTITQRQEADTRSIYVKGFPPQTTARDLAEFFIKRIGTVVRSTVLMNRHDGRSLGYAYLEFDGKELAQRAIYMDSALRTMCVGIFNGKEINVELIVKAKRTNLPGFRKVMAPRPRNDSNINSKNVTSHHSKQIPNYILRARETGEHVKSFFTNEDSVNRTDTETRRNSDEQIVSQELVKENNIDEEAKEDEDTDTSKVKHKGKLIFTTRTHEEAMETSDG